MKHRMTTTCDRNLRAIANRDGGRRKIRKTGVEYTIMRRHVGGGAHVENPVSGSLNGELVHGIDKGSLIP